MDLFSGHPWAVDWGLLILRIGIGMSFLVHGLQKRAMWKTRPSEHLSAGMHSILRLLSVAEPLGAVAVLTGFLTQAAAIGLAIIMLGAIRVKALVRHKTFSETGGWELDFILLASSLALVLLGAGPLSLDRLLFPA